MKRRPVTEKDLCCVASSLHACMLSFSPRVTGERKRDGQTLAQKFKKARPARELPPTQSKATQTMGSDNGGSAAAAKDLSHVQLRQRKVVRYLFFIPFVILLKLSAESWTVRKTQQQALTVMNGVTPTVHATVIQAPSVVPIVNVSNVKYVYMIGRDRPFSRTNNQLMAIVRALDIIFDTHGELSNQNDGCCAAVLGIGGWARDTLKEFFFQEQKHRDWSTRLESTVPIITLDRVRSLPGNPIIYRNYTGPDYFKYHARPLDGPKQQVLKKRRQMILGPLFANPSNQTLQGYDLLQQHLVQMAANNDQLVPGKYMVVHSRNLEGSCIERLGDLLPPDECDMNPTYMKRLLRHYDLFGSVAIVVISDMQNLDIIHSLQQDEDIGKYVVVPALDIEGWTNETATDMMVAIRSDWFVGTRISTMALMIGMARAVTGKDPKSNLVYVDEDLNVCEDCIYYCNAKRTTICGGRRATT